MHAEPQKKSHAGKKIKEKQPQNPQEKHFSPRAKHKKVQQGNRKEIQQQLKVWIRKRRRKLAPLACSPGERCLSEQNSGRLPAPRSRWYSHIIPEQQHSLLQSGGSTQKPSASQTLLQFSIAIAQDEWLRKWISRENKTRLSPSERHRQPEQQPWVCWALVSSSMHLPFFPKS